MNLSDQQLMLLEQLTYLLPAVAAAAGVPYVEPTAGKTVEDLLKEYDEQVLAAMDESTETVRHTQMTEWAAVIRAIQNDPELTDLKISNVGKNDRGDIIALCFTDPEKDDGQAVVAFRGTLNDEEWEDDALGMTQSDTKNQQEALDYIESLPYDDIAVVGHSKGGNKAQYVTITSDKVTRCVSMDGQGFSEEFLEKYANEIEERGGLITNYSLNNDYVHILLYPMPNSTQIYVQGDGMATWEENHGQNSFFQYEQTADGKWVLKYEDGEVQIVETSEDESVAYLHGFMTFVMHEMPDGELDDMASFIGIVLALAMGPSGTTRTIDGVTYTKDDLMDYFEAHPEELATLLAYLFKYAEVYGLTGSQILELLRYFGLGDVVDKWYEEAALTIGVEKALEELLDNLGDGLPDPILVALLSVVFGKLGIDMDASELWNSVEKKYRNIGWVDKSEDLTNEKVSGSITRDFSSAAYESLLSAISSLESGMFGTVDGWSSYSGEEWYDSLLIGLMVKGIRAYENGISEVNEECKKRIRTVFENEQDLDRGAAAAYNEVMGLLMGVQASLQSLKDRIG